MHGYVTVHWSEKSIGPTDVDKLSLSAEEKKRYIPFDTVLWRNNDKKYNQYKQMLSKLTPVGIN